MPPLRILFLFVAACLATAVVAAPNEQEVARYTELRWSLFNTSSFNPYLAQAVEKALTDECMKLWRSGKGADAFSKCKEALTAFPASILANRMLADMFQVYATSSSATEFQQKQLRAFEAEHRSAAEGLLQSILASGDGHTEDTAFRVIIISEEYMLLWYLGCSRIDQQLVSHGDKRFDVLRVRDRNGNEKTIYFDVSPFSKKSGG